MVSVVTSVAMPFIYNSVVSYFSLYGKYVLYLYEDMFCILQLSPKKDLQCVNKFCSLLFISTAWSYLAIFLCNPAIS